MLEHITLEQETEKHHRHDHAVDPVAEEGMRDTRESARGGYGTHQSAMGTIREAGGVRSSRRKPKTAMRDIFPKVNVTP